PKGPSLTSNLYQTKRDGAPSTPAILAKASAKSYLIALLVAHRNGFALLLCSKLSVLSVQRCVNLLSSLISHQPHRNTYRISTWQAVYRKSPPPLPTTLEHVLLCSPLVPSRFGQHRNPLTLTPY